MKRYSPDAVIIDRKICNSAYGTFEVKVYDAMDNLVEQKEEPIDSFVRPLINDWYGKIGATGMTSSWLSLDGVTTQSWGAQTTIGAKGGNGSYVGIIVGTGSTAPAFADLTMSAIVQHGTSAGQLFYEPCSVVNMAWDESPLVGQLYVSRTFRNTSGGSISVAEIGLASIRAGVAIGSATALSDAILTVRDVLSSAVSVPNGGYIAVMYKFALAHGCINYHQLVLSWVLGNTGTTSSGSYRSTGVFQSGANTGYYSFIADSANDTEGIVLSTNSDPFSFLTYEIRDKISHGTGAGQLLYFSCDVGQVQIDTSTGNCFLLLVRDFFNDTASAITVNSIGIRQRYAIANQGFYAAVDQQPLTVPITINPQTGRTFVYRFCYQF